MERLWAPWRMQYIERPKQSVAACVLCTAAAAAEDAIPHVLTRGEACFAMLNRYPYNNGHLMIVPHDHVSDLAEVSPAGRAEMMDLASAWTAVLREAVKADGFNLGLNLGAAAGAGIDDHLHLHLVPRWRGDTNFMPVVADTKVMPEDLDQTFRKLRRAWDDRFGSAWEKPR